MKVTLAQAGIVAGILTLSWVVGGPKEILSAPPTGNHPHQVFNTTSKAHAEKVASLVPESIVKGDSGHPLNWFVMSKTPYAEARSYYAPWLRENDYFRTNQFLSEVKYEAEYQPTEGYEDCEVCYATVEEGTLNDVQAGRLCDDCHSKNQYAYGTGRQNNPPFHAEYSRQYQHELWREGDMRIVADYDEDFWNQDVEGWFEDEEEHEQFRKQVKEHGVYVLTLEKQVQGEWEGLDAVGGNVPNENLTLMDIAKEQFEFKDAESKKLNPIEKPIISGAASGATIEGLEDLMMSEPYDSEDCPLCLEKIDFGDAYEEPDNYHLCDSCDEAVQEKRYDHAYSAEDEDTTTCEDCGVKIGYDEAIDWEGLDRCEDCYDYWMMKDRQNYTGDETDCISCGFSISPNDVRFELVEGLCPDCKADGSFHAEEFARSNISVPKDWVPKKYPYDRRVVAETKSKWCENCGELDDSEEDAWNHYQFFLKQKNSTKPVMRFISGGACEGCGSDLCQNCMDGATSGNFNPLFEPICDDCGYPFCKECKDEDRCDNCEEEHESNRCDCCGHVHHAESFSAEENEMCPSCERAKISQDHDRYLVCPLCEWRSDEPLPCRHLNIEITDTDYDGEYEGGVMVYARCEDCYADGQAFGVWEFDDYNAEGKSFSAEENLSGPWHRKTIEGVSLTREKFLWKSTYQAEYKGINATIWYLGQVNYSPCWRYYIYNWNDSKDRMDTLWNEGCYKNGLEAVMGFKKDVDSGKIIMDVKSPQYKNQFAHRRMGAESLADRVPFPSSIPSAGTGSSGQMCEVCNESDDLPYDADYFKNCRRCGKAVCHECWDTHIESDDDYHEVCMDCWTVLDNVARYDAEGDVTEDLAEVRTDLSQKRTNMSALRTALSVAGLFLVWDSWRWSKEERKLKGL